MQESARSTLGVNNGYYKGYEAIMEYYTAWHELQALRTKLVKDANPEEFADKSLEEMYGAGSLDVNNLTTPIIELADDRKTAKGLWYYWRGDTNYEANGINTNHKMGWLAIDFVCEDGAWKIWHMLEAEDLDFRAGTTWVETAEPMPVDPAYAAIGEFQFPQPNVPMNVYEKWHDRRKNVDFPGVPKPYDTFADTFSYGI